MAKIPSPGDIPPATFQNFVTELASTALVCLGYINNPVSKAKSLELPRAKHIIELLEVLLLKTKGNLNDNEEQYLMTVVADLRIKYRELDEPGASTSEST